MSQTEPHRTESRTFTWQKPGQGDVAEMLARDGLGQLQLMIDGGYPGPPMLSTLGISDFRAEVGRVVVEMPVREFHYNPLGVVHGGVISSLLDTAAGCAVHSTLAVGEDYTSLDLTVKFLRSVTLQSEILSCEGIIIQRGARTALAQAQLRDGRGRLVAHATSTSMIFGSDGS